MFHFFSVLQIEPKQSLLQGSLSPPVGTLRTIFPKLLHHHPFMLHPLGAGELDHIRAGAVTR
jgi:hypothetical protein